MAFSGLF